MKNPLAAATIAAAALGGVAGATVLGPGIAGAQDDAENQSFDTFADRLSEVLQPLVDDGTIDESQRDAVVDQLEANRPRPAERGFGRGHRHGPPIGAEIAEILGLERAEIAEALRGGDSLADLADANGVDPQDLVDAIVDAAEERVDGAVEAGRIDTDEAEEILAAAEQRATDAVNGELRFGHGPGPNGDGPGFPGGAGVDSGGDEPASA